jgi:hypothetical protein
MIHLQKTKAFSVYDVVPVNTAKAGNATILNGAENVATAALPILKTQKPTFDKKIYFGDIKGDQPMPREGRHYIARVDQPRLPSSDAILLTILQEISDFIRRNQPNQVPFEGAGGSRAKVLYKGIRI